MVEEEEKAKEMEDVAASGGLVSGGPAGSQGLKKSSIFCSAKLSSVSLLWRAFVMALAVRPCYTTTVALQAYTECPEHFGHLKQLIFNKIKE